MRRHWIGGFLILLAFLISVHHLIVAGRWFDLRDVLHHEFFIAVIGGLGIGLIIGSRGTQNPQ